jgi:hypothetical protein
MNNKPICVEVRVRIYISAREAGNTPLGEPSSKVDRGNRRSQSAARSRPLSLAAALAEQELENKDNS